MVLTLENAGALIPGNTGKEIAMEKVTIRILRAFYRNKKILYPGSIVRDVPKAEAVGYEAVKRAEIVDPSTPAHMAPAPKKNAKPAPTPAASESGKKEK